MHKLIQLIGKIVAELVGGGNGWRTLRLGLILLAATLIALAIILQPGCTTFVDVDGQARTLTWRWELSPWSIDARDRSDTDDPTTRPTP